MFSSLEQGIKPYVGLAWIELMNLKNKVCCGKQEYYRQGQPQGEGAPACEKIWYKFQNKIRLNQL